jgi:hypothetical protein
MVADDLGRAQKPEILLLCRYGASLRTTNREIHEADPQPD